MSVRAYKKHIPLVAVRGLAVIPGMIIHFDIAKDGAISAIERAMVQKDQQVFIVMNRESEDGPDGPLDPYPVGCICAVKQVLKLPNKTIRVLVEGIRRGRIENIDEQDQCLIGTIRPIVDKDASGYESETDPEKVAVIQSFMATMKDYLKYNPKVEKILSKCKVSRISFADLMDMYAAHLPMTAFDRQKLLEAAGERERAVVFCAILENEINILRVRQDLQEQVRDRVDKNQKEYILREQLKAIKDELGEGHSLTDEEEYLEKIDKLKASKEVKDKLKKEVDRMSQVSFYSSESGVIRAYIETLLEMPWDKMSKDNRDLKKAERILEEDHYGLEKVKERMLEFLAVRNLTKKGDSPIVCLVGPPGTGKTSIAKSVARALDKKYVRISLGGIRDEAEIRGHRKTYVGAMPGRIAMGLKNAGVKNPLFLLDEIDKTSSDYRGDTASALLEVLDGEQNNKFRDHYIELPIDLSQVLFIATANSASDIPRPLLDRMEIIEVSSYTENEKVHIAKEHLIHKQFEKNGIKDGQLTISDKALELIIRGYTREAGVRNLERKIGQIARKAAKEILTDGKKSIKVTPAGLEKFLGKPRYEYDKANEENEVGIVRGLAWTAVGGDTLQIEVNVMPGKGELKLTGQLGDVMKESAQAGVSYIRSISTKNGIKADYFAKHDIHIHIPQGSVPKDGPSAGITMATAIYSAVTGIPVRADVAMTGEITLRGRVLPIGGLKEKTLAAKNAGIKTVLVPKKNDKDIAEISDEILKGLKIVYVETMEDVLKEALVKKERPARTGRARGSRS
ncbi:MAG: endopeptidase La [Lachnospiraceae bacterium]|nr:endopeptidase La [Lachnospiraceae bacterium]